MVIEKEQLQWLIGFFDKKSSGSGVANKSATKPNY